MPTQEDYMWLPQNSDVDRLSRRKEPVELSIFGVRTLSYLIGQPRYGLVFCDVVLHTFFCGLSLDSIS